MTKTLHGFRVLALALFFCAGAAQADGILGTWHGQETVTQTGPDAGAPRTCNMGMSISSDNNSITVDFDYSKCTNKDDAGSTYFTGPIDSSGNFQATQDGDDDGRTIVGQLSNSSIEWTGVFGGTSDGTVTWKATATASGGSLQYESTATISVNQGFVETTSAQLSQ